MNVSYRHPSLSDNDDTSRKNCMNHKMEFCLCASWVIYVCFFFDRVLHVDSLSTNILRTKTDIPNNATSEISFTPALRLYFLKYHLK